MKRGMTFAEAYEYGGNKMVEVNGEWKYISQWCEQYNVNQRKVAKLIKDGLKPKDALLTARMNAAREKKEKELKRLKKEGYVSPEEAWEIEDRLRRRRRRGY